MMAAPSRPGTAIDPVVAQPIVPDKSIDCIGLFCPIPILKTREAMKSLTVGQILEMLFDDPSSDPDMKSWAQRTGNELLEISRNVGSTLPGPAFIQLEGVTRGRLRNS